MLSRLMSMNPAGIVLLLLGVAVMLAGKIIPERFKIAGKLVRAGAGRHGRGAVLSVKEEQDEQSGMVQTGRIRHDDSFRALFADRRRMARRADAPSSGEWAQSYFRIPGSEYGQLRQAFNPLLFDAEEWVKTAKDAGMQYMVVTSKHHDGFCLFHTKWDDYNVVDGTPFQRDIIEELANACARHGLKLGLYYSEELDWHEPDGGGYTRPHQLRRDELDQRLGFPGERYCPLL